MAGAGNWLRSVVAGKRPAGRAILPLLERLAPRVAGVSYRVMTSDATAWAGALTQAARLVDTDALALGWEQTLLAEACGAALEWEADAPRLSGPAASFNAQAAAAGRMPAYLEAARRLCQTRGEGACLLAVTGPATLARQVFGLEATKDLLEQLKPVLVAVVEELCKSRPDFIVFMESDPDSAAPLTPELRRSYGTLKNIAAYYGVASALYLDGCKEWGASTERWQQVKLEHLILGADSEQGLEQLAASGAAASFFALQPAQDAMMRRQTWVTA